MFAKLLLLALLGVVSLADSNSMLRVIDNPELKRLQKNPRLRLTPFSPRRNVDIYRRFIPAEPFNGCSPLINTGALDVQSYFVLVDGRLCSYRQKAYHAIQAGAMGIIIIDDDPNRLEEPYASFSDGQFLSFLIDEKQGMIIKNFMKEKSLETVEVEVTYTMSPRKDALVELWVSAIDQSSYNILSDWNDTLRDVPALAGKVQWKPRYVIYGCVSGSLDPSRSCNSSIATLKSCACGGEFCSPSEISTTSNTIIMEDLRQKEIYSKFPEKYMAYIGGIQTRCLEKYKRDKNIDMCSERVATDLGMDLTLINEKVQDAARKCTNALYDDVNSDKYMYTHVNEYPSFTVDRQIVRVRDRTEMKNYMCNKLGLQQEEGCLQRYVAPSSTSWYFYMFLIVAVALSGFGVFLLYRRMIRREINREISMQVSTAIEHYFSMNETKD